MYQSEAYDKDPIAAELKSYGDRLLPGAAEALAASWRRSGWPVTDGAGGLSAGVQTAREVARRLADPDPFTAAFVDPDAKKPGSKHPLRNRLDQLVADGSLKPESADAVFAELVKTPRLAADPVGAAGRVAAFLAKRENGQFLTERRPISETEARLRRVIDERFPLNVPADRVDSLVESLQRRGVGHKPDAEIVRTIAADLAGPGAVAFGDGERLKPDDPRLREGRVPLEPAVATTPRF